VKPQQPEPRRSPGAKFCSAPGRDKDEAARRAHNAHLIRISSHRMRFFHVLPAEALRCSLNELILVLSLKQQ